MNGCCPGGPLLLRLVRLLPSSPHGRPAGGPGWLPRPVPRSKFWAAGPRRTYTDIAVLGAEHKKQIRRKAGGRAGGAQEQPAPWPAMAGWGGPAEEVATAVQNVDFQGAAYDTAGGGGQSAILGGQVAYRGQAETSDMTGWCGFAARRQPTRTLYHTYSLLLAFLPPLQKRFGL
eukprot:SAG22_NODE_814_length_7044_cov_24.348884_6_plen_174_part_00